MQLFLIYFGLPSLLGIDLFPSTIDLHLFSISGSILAGIIAFSLHETAYMSEITRSGIRSIDRGQNEAALALGMTSALAMRRIILPQACRVIVPSLGNQFNLMFKTTAFLSVIAVPELVHVADTLRSDNFKTFEVYAAISVYYLLLSGIWMLFQRWVEIRLSQRSRKATHSSTMRTSTVLRMED